MIEEALATAPIRVGRDTCLIPKAKLAHPHKWRRKPKGEREARYERYNVFRAIDSAYRVGDLNVC
ncbi:hypothetical protein ACVWZV_008043 [Bradyrhizobium sp. GM5.1]